MNEEETEQNYSEKGVDMFHGPLLKKIIFLRCLLPQAAFCSSYSTLLMLRLQVGLRKVAPWQQLAAIRFWLVCS